MTKQAYIAIDLGAESGRVMAGLWDGRTMGLEEIHRFPNGPVNIADTLRWDVVRLWQEIEHGLSLSARKFGQSIRSIGVDTWALDYVFLSQSDELAGLPFCYRDARTRGGVDRMCSQVSREEIFAASGLQFMEINTLCQILAQHERSPEILEMARTFLMIPDYLNWLLCGKKAAEFTNATSTQFVHPRKRTWSVDLLQKFGLPAHFLPEIVAPGTSLAPIRASLADRTGLGPVNVVAPATHDTGSAVVGVPTERTGKPNWAYISSGTWSLLGVEVENAVLSPEALQRNLTNEGGVDGTYRLLKNIMGLWLLQQARRSFEARGHRIDYPELVELGRISRPLVSLINPDDHRFLNPPDMAQSIAEFCRETGQPVPADEGAFVRCILESLALKYQFVLEQIEELTGTAVDVVHIVGGGARNLLLNQLTADACSRPVAAGPVEATALGNLFVQARTGGELSALAEIRTAVRASSEVRVFEPTRGAGWELARERMRNLCEPRD